MQTGKHSSEECMHKALKGSLVSLGIEGRDSYYFQCSVIQPVPAVTSSTRCVTEHGIELKY